jgi:hypothetical protein
MKVKLSLVVCCASLAFVSSAQAFHWHMRYGQAKHASKAFVQEACREDSKCTGYGVGQCYRASEGRFDCEVGTFYADTPSLGEELECNIALHWGVSYSGYMVLKNHGTPHCFQV